MKQQNNLILLIWSYLKRQESEGSWNSDFGTKLIKVHKHTYSGYQNALFQIFNHFLNTAMEVYSGASHLCRNALYFTAITSLPNPGRVCCSTSHQPTGSADWSIDHLAAVSYTSQSFDLLELWEWARNSISIEPLKQLNWTANLRNFLLPDRSTYICSECRVGASKLSSHTHGEIEMWISMELLIPSCCI